MGHEIEVRAEGGARSATIPLSIFVESGTADFRCTKAKRKRRRPFFRSICPGGGQVCRY